MMYLKRKKVFISYAREDMRVAARLFEYLKSNGHIPWMDTENNVPGQSFPYRTRTKLLQADAILVLLSISSVKKEGMVAAEFDLAARQIKKPCKMVFPLLLDDECEIPVKFKYIHAIKESHIGDEEILRQLATWNCRSKIFVSILCLAAVFTLVFLFFSESFSNRNTTVLFKATVKDFLQKQPIPGAIAFILSPDNDTIIKSKPADSDGRVEFHLDTLENTNAGVWYYHPGFKKVVKHYTLMTHEPYRVVFLEATDTVSSVQQVVPNQNYFTVSGIVLTMNEKKEIKEKTGFQFSSKSPMIFTIDYDHTAYIESPVKGYYRFEGSPVYIKANNTLTDTGLQLLQSSSSPQKKESIELENLKLLTGLVNNNRALIISKLIQCIHQN